MSGISKEAEMFLSELDELCKKHGLDVHGSSDYGVVIFDFDMDTSWSSYAKSATDESRFSKDGSSD